MSRAAKLAELRALRAAGKTRLSTYTVQEEEKVYEEVGEEEYKQVVRKRLDEDDFVVDDNGEGYADDGREEWDTRHRYESDDSEEEEMLPKAKAAAKRKREEDREKIEKENHNINKYFMNGPAAPAPKPKVVATAADADFMENLLGELNPNIVSSRPAAFPRPMKIDARRKVRVLSPPAKTHSSTKYTTSHLPSPPNDENQENIRDSDEPMFFADDFDDNAAPSSPIAKAMERKIKIEEEDDEDLLEIAPAYGKAGVASANINISGSRPAPKIQKQSAYPSPANSSPTKPHAREVDASTWNDINSKLNVMSSPSVQGVGFGKSKIEDCMEDDGSIQMFWTDYTEVNGSLFLFGKVKDQKSKTYVSGMIKVDNILRKLYFLPREFRRKHGKMTDEEVDMSDVYQEVDGMMSKLKVQMHKIKPCSRKYAFELPDVPKEADYLKLMYPYDKPALPLDTTGETFSRVFGAGTALFEQFVLWKRILGPCWLKIEPDSFAHTPSCSSCKLEVQVPGPKTISVLPDSEAPEVPPMTYMSIAMRTTLNTKENKQEILAISARVYENMSLTDTTPTEKLPCKMFTVMRPLENAYPIGFESLCKQQRSTIMCEKNEQMLLSKFLALLEKADPDVLMGHGIQEIDYPTLLGRMREKKTPKWSRIGRLSRSEWPKNMGKSGSAFFAERHLVSGRLICDIGNDMGKSLMTKCQSWTLTEMCDVYLQNGNTRQELDNEIVLKTWAQTKDGLMDYINHCEVDTFIIAAIALRVQILPLSKVLTNLAGNSWARTLAGTRAERNEYILLHEFHKNKYICPDKIYGKNKAKAEEEPVDGEEGVDVKKKDKYKGGLVFEPEKGLYENIILVMDFNSLYPSIIQEYNICFTTVERSGMDGEDDDQTPEVPAEQAQGILPKLIATLVSRRREVKKLMKDKRATPEQLATWDIKQLALKLTANSMYGCLGYSQSRFYARPLAMLTTAKGREILRSTKELAESIQLQVIYGDTDSVMINTNVQDITEALRIGNDFKKSVNDRYKLLEIDIDNLFRRLLLHAKKKYAAINLVENNGSWTEKLEVKGLDMRRREYCPLSKEASTKILNEILSGQDQDLVVSKIADYLRELATSMREEKVPYQKYIILTKLGKDPRSYPNAESMPQVQVALRALAAGKSVRVNDVILYITTATTQNSSDNPAKRAYSPQDVQKSNGELKPDVDWYLAKQLFPPLERLIAPMQAMSGGMLAECLGLDPKRYAMISSSSNSAANEFELSPLDSQLPDSVRYQDCPRLMLICLGCRNKFQFLGLASDIQSDIVETLGCLSPNGITCPDTSCGRVMSTLTVVAQVEHAIRSATALYYDGWLICDDSSCGNRTRSMSVYGHRCLGPQGLARGCLGKMRYEKSGRWIGSTLSYWRSLFDVEKQSPALSKAFKVEVKNEGEEKSKDADLKERVDALKQFNRARFDIIKEVVEGYEKKCGWSWISMERVFRFALS